MTMNENPSGWPSARAFPKRPRSVLVMDVLVVLAASFGLSFAADLHSTGYYDSGALTVAHFLILIPICAVALWAAKCLLRHFASSESRTPLDRFAERHPITVSTRSVAAYTLVALILWVIYAVALFPCSTAYDTLYMIQEWDPAAHPLRLNPYNQTDFFVDTRFTDHHPIFDVLLYGSVARLSGKLFGSWTVGLFGLALAQVICTAAAIILSIAYLERLGVRPKHRLVLFIAMCILPFFPIFSLTLCKDSLFSWLYLVYFVSVVETARTKGSFLKKRRNLVLTLLLIVLICLTKKTGVYVVLGTCLVLCLAFRKAWAQFLAQAGTAVVLMWVILPMIVFPLLDVSPGGKQEALATLFQMTARNAVEHGNETTEEEREAIDRVLGYEDLAERYAPSIADPVKDFWNYETTREELTAYLKVWLSQGIRHPDTYLKSLLATSSPFISLSKNINIYRDLIVSEGSHASRPEITDGLRKAVFSIYDWLCGLPVISVLFKIGLYSFFIPLLSLSTLFERHRGLTVAMVPVCLSLMACLLSPVAFARYALPLIYSAPCLVGLALAPSGPQPDAFADQEEAQEQ